MSVIFPHLGAAGAKYPVTDVFHTDFHVAG
jgi:hypothetical protein